MTGKHYTNKKIKKSKTKQKIKNTKRYGVGELCIAFLEKMPKCEPNKNQKIKKSKTNNFFYVLQKLEKLFF